MKYFGKKSLSSFLSSFLHVFWYVALVCSILIAVFGIIMIYISFGDQTTSEFARCDVRIFEMNAHDKADWETFKNLPMAIKFLLMPYFTGVVVLLLRIIKISREVFTNFKNDIVFNKNNVLLISKISKLMIAFSIVTFSLNSLILGVLLLMLCEILKNGTALQEEHDLTV
jgi:hypothetical protein